MQPITAHPLVFPPNQPRAKTRHTSQFGKRKGSSGYTRKITLAEARDAVLEQLGTRGFGAHRITISSNLELRNDGLPRSGQRQPSDPGVAVYFFRKLQPFVLACDKWDTVEANLYAIALHLDALRGMERWCVGTLEQTMKGYELPAPSARGWWDVLGVARDTPFATIRMTYWHLTKIHHPDRGGDAAKMAEINRAWDEAQKLL
jgi:hypothetical protein